ncbi:MAG: hypothetical protein AAGB93_01755 [Planctomycetota bacterium]
MNQTTHRSLLQAPLHLLALAGFVAAAVALGCRSSSASSAQDAIAEGTSRTRQVIADEVEDPEHRAQALALVDGYAERERAFLDRSLEFRKEIAALHAEHGTTRGQYEDVMRRLSAHRVAFADDMLESWLQLEELLDDDAVAALVKGQREEEERWRAMMDD